MLCVFAQEKAQLEERLGVCEERLASLTDSHDALRSQGMEERCSMEQERLIHAQLLDELTKELEELRTSRLQTQGDSMSSRLRHEYDAQISHLKQVSVDTSTKVLLETCLSSLLGSVIDIINVPLRP